jgi:hypothetical protein
LPRPDGGEIAGLLVQTGPGAAVDGPSHAAAHLELRVRGVDDRVDVLLVSDVPADELEGEVSDLMFHL